MDKELKILVVEDSESFRETLLQLLGVYMDVDGAANLESARETLKATSYDVVILDKGLPDGDGMSLIREIKSDSPNTVVIILTEDGGQNSAKRCMQLGADDYVVKTQNCVTDLLVRIPFVVERAAEVRNSRSLKDQIRQAFKYEIIGSSPSTAALREQILSVKGAMSHFLITGESGTGKELIARRINALTDGKARPLVVLNCGAIPQNLIEAELFGHQKGSFTGAIADQPGKFELAHNGDLFLDEIGDLPYEAQSKLLRVIQDGAFFRIGGRKPIHVSFRLIAATNKNLEEMVRRKEFREDLFYRLNVIRIHTVPLRARIEDVPGIAMHFCRELGGASLTISDRATKKLLKHDWPGNIRELRNVIERAYLHMNYRLRNSSDANRLLDAEDISFDRVTGPAADIRSLEVALPSDIAELSGDGYQNFLIAAERAYFVSALSATNGSAPEVAARLGLARSTVFKKLAALGIPRRIYGAKSSPTEVGDEVQGITPGELRI